eukprot:CAMPEP_0167826164 /NCGR_PEP_ID=MMETSP0112_2-20121227/9846_1 /TAXON_ID=91324 /ORGANISM="Lotharella globosa, Strain CCCM811" /LENGTH=59 /DNA_ID=CAMNT_0007728505 /DNA_START=484 /DNA_END=663 /DNA_ORIENTATION=-
MMDTSGHFKVPCNVNESIQYPCSRTRVDEHGSALFEADVHRKILGLKDVPIDLKLRWDV